MRLFNILAPSIYGGYYGETRLITSIYGILKSFTESKFIFVEGFLSSINAAWRKSPVTPGRNNRFATRIVCFPQVDIPLLYDLSNKYCILINFIVLYNLTGTNIY